MAVGEWMEQNTAMLNQRTQHICSRNVWRKRTVARAGTKLSATSPTLDFSSAPMLTPKSCRTPLSELDLPPVELYIEHLVHHSRPVVVVVPQPILVILQHGGHINQMPLMPLL